MAACNGRTSFSKTQPKIQSFRISIHPSVQPCLLCPHPCILLPSLDHSSPSNPSIKPSDVCVCGRQNCLVVICNVNMWLRIDQRSLWKPLEHNHRRTHTHTQCIFREQAAAAWLSSVTPTKP